VLRAHPGGGGMCVWLGVLCPPSAAWAVRAHQPVLLHVSLLSPAGGGAV
jgi:hypothetical protein